MIKKTQTKPKQKTKKTLQTNKQIKKKPGEKPKQNITNFIFINRSGMGKVSIVSIPDLRFTLHILYYKKRWECHRI
jgi:hypothetical protein